MVPGFGGGLLGGGELGGGELGGGWLGGGLLLGGVVGPVEPVQATPLRVNDVGLVFVPEYSALKPRLTVALVPRLAAHDGFVAVTFAPDWV